ncbi:MAG: 50S ribosomal protein L5 [Candidatus Bathyarchaeia archaeon]
MMEEVSRRWNDNPMLKPVISKVCVNVCVGKSGEPLERASKMLEELTGQRPCRRKAKKTIRDFGIRKGEPIACLVTLRGERAYSFLHRAFQAINSQLKKEMFDKFGNVSFGIKEHIEIPGVKYIPEIGVHGMDVSISLGRPGYRVKDRKVKRSKIGSNHLLNREEAILFLKEEFGLQIV